jgi:hypothetical protein
MDKEIAIIICLSLILLVSISISIFEGYYIIDLENTLSGNTMGDFQDTTVKSNTILIPNHRIYFSDSFNL